MRWWGTIAGICVGCTALNPAFDLSSGTGEGSAEVGEGSLTSGVDSEGDGSSESGEVPLICPPFYDGPPAIASVTMNDFSGARVCGGSFFGRLRLPDTRVVNEYLLECDDACEGPCPAGPYTVLFANGAPNLGLGVPCAQVFLAGADEGGGCSFSGMGVLDPSGAVLYGAGTRDSLFDPLLSSLVPITIEMHEPCRCADESCCDTAPGGYKMVVTTEVDQAFVYPGEAGFVTLGGRAYEFQNLRAHVHPECGGEGHFDWLAKLAP